MEIKALKRHYISSPRNSYCGSARLKDLDFTRWYMDQWNTNEWRYLHVQGIGNDYCPRDTWHRVRPRTPKGHTVRLGMDSRGLYWLFDKRRAK